MGQFRLGWVVAVHPTDVDQIWSRPDLHRSAAVVLFAGPTVLRVALERPKSTVSLRAPPGDWVEGSAIEVLFEIDGPSAPPRVLALGRPSPNPLRILVASPTHTGPPGSKERKAEARREARSVLESKLVSAARGLQRLLSPASPEWYRQLVEAGLVDSVAELPRTCEAPLDAVRHVVGRDRFVSWDSHWRNDCDDPVGELARIVRASASFRLLGIDEETSEVSYEVVAEAGSRRCVAGDLSALAEQMDRVLVQGGSALRLAYLETGGDSYAFASVDARQWVALKRLKLVDGGRD